MSVAGVTQWLLPSFSVFASRHPIETEGTYALPEAQVDRFMLKVEIPYPAEGVERGILGRYLAGFEADDPATYGVAPVTDAAGVAALAAAAPASLPNWRRVNRLKAKSFSIDPSSFVVLGFDLDQL